MPGPRFVVKERTHAKGARGTTYWVYDRVMASYPIVREGEYIQDDLHDDRELIQAVVDRLNQETP